MFVIWPTFIHRCITFPADGGCDARGDVEEARGIPHHAHGAVEEARGLSQGVAAVILEEAAGDVRRMLQKDVLVQRGH